MKRSLSSILIAVVLTSSLSTSAFAEETKERYATRGEIVRSLLGAADHYNPGVKKEDIIKGYENGEMKENEPVLRVEALAMISRAFAELPVPVGNDLRSGTFNTEFTDIPAWAKNDIAKLSAAGVVTGYPDGKLGANDNITNEQLQTVIARIWALEGSNPSDDFYETINKSWLNKSTIPAGDLMGGGFNDLSRENDDKLKTILNELKTGQFKDGTKEQKIADFYIAALDTESRNKQGIEPIAQYLTAIDGAKSLKELVAADLKLEKATGVSTLLQFGIMGDAKNSAVNSLYYTGVNRGLDKNSYVTGDAKAKESYTAYITKLLVLAGEDESAAKAKAEKIYEMEKDISSVSLDPQEQGDVTKYYNPYTMEQFTGLYPQLDVAHIMKEFKISHADKVIVFDVKAANKSAEYLTEDHLELLKAYAKVWTLMATGGLLTDDFRDASNEFSASLYGVTGVKTNDELAVATTKGVMSDYLGQIYADKHFTAAAKQDVQSMVNQFITTYKERLNAIDWMSDITKTKAIKKLDTMTMKIGYPDKWKDTLDKVAIKTYDKGGSLFANSLAVARASANEQKEKLGKAVDKSEWMMSVYEVNAYYNPLNNEIVFPAGILQAPFYDVNAKREANLGAIGMVIAHEISHAFDNNGAAYDEKGNANNWWTEEDFKKFQEKCQAVIDFYNGIEIVPGTVNNGELTLSENVADLGGMATSLEVLSKLPSPDLKAYFESNATIWRITMTKEISAYLSANDVHSANKLRTNRTVVNFPEFYKTYGIEPGDGMYVAPENRVSIW